METIECRTEQQVTHCGTVVSAAPGEVRVRILRLSGCASCAAHARCGLSEQKETVITVPTHRWRDYHEGDSVTVAVASRRGMQAVVIAYILPSLVLLAAFVVCHSCGFSEPLSALVSLGVVALYMGILYLLRRKVNRRFEFRLIAPTEE